jgi:hypothetical protein
MRLAGEKSLVEARDRGSPRRALPNTPLPADTLTTTRTRHYCRILPRKPRPFTYTDYNKTCKHFLDAMNSGLQRLSMATTNQ